MSDTKIWDGTQWASGDGAQVWDGTQWLPLTSGGAAPPSGGWLRPADWLPLNVLPTESKVQILVAVFDSTANWIGYAAINGQTVDWGDGQTQPITSSAPTYHNYNWNDIPASTLTSDGFRQAIITITGPFNNGLNLNVNHPPALSSLSSTHLSNGALEIKTGKMTGASFNQILLSNSTAPAGTLDCSNFLRSVVITDPEPTSPYKFACGGSVALESISIPDAVPVQIDSRAFEKCSDIQYLPKDMTVTAGSTLCFSGCTFLRTVPHLTFLGGDLASMFASCQGVSKFSPMTLSVPITSVSGTFSAMNSLTEIPALDLSGTTTSATWGSMRSLRRVKAYGMRKSVLVNNTLLDAPAINELFTNLGTADNSGGQQTVNVTNCPGAATCDRSIATAKGWTVTG